ncbi:hypothetical protein CFY87_07495 [Actinobacillus seminis]|uniref:Glyoxalase/bleomycin resistance protein/dioxygenase n=1 Tax=Actinobacillus seminis TaxID=722 RepID=A0A263HD08_9PAST|nr:hypothetical protein CFY87_07495 [Actinobacillus seminis]SUU35402.1 glyoxalase/bleomycin resistance protein/dioxygenase [Actinobacillus seminis]
MELFIKGFHHVALIVSDYERSKHFYTEILGAKVIQETYRAAKQSYKLDPAFAIRILCIILHDQNRLNINYRRQYEKICYSCRRVSAGSLF